ncbi:helix-turn-helix domain-containing protein [Micromonospora zamorensis]|uniref:helix-turn-helix domain-containing protein n=1 Tax=Micromonospora zamorensis TaxID=709883 RepID=UPI00367B16C0
MHDVAWDDVADWFEQRFGVSRQAVHRWLAWYQDEGLDGLADRSSRPHSSPGQTPPEVEALICELRRNHPRWGAPAF